MAIKVLNSLGFTVIGANSSATAFVVVRWGLMIDHLVKTFLHLKAAFVAIGANDKSMSAYGYARMAYKIIVGEETSFELAYG